MIEAKGEVSKDFLYGSKKVNVPTPELYVIFTGERKKYSRHNITFQGIF